jgi:hypothetical protein
MSDQGYGLITHPCCGVGTSQGPLAISSGECESRYKIPFQVLLSGIVTIIDVGISLDVGISQAMKQNFGSDELEFSMRPDLSSRLA